MAGCIGPADEALPGPETESPGSLAFDGCREVLGLWDLDYEEVAAYLPPGFEPVSFLLPPQDDTGRNASMDLLAISCTQPQEATLLIPWLSVIPPDRFTDPQAEAYRVMLPCIGDAALAEVIQGWGAPCQASKATIETETTTPLGATWVFEANSPNLTVRMEGTGAATAQMSDEPLFRQFHVADREVCTVTHLELEDHIHWQGHAFNLEVDGEAPFPTPEEPGAGLLAQPGFSMEMTPVETELRAATEACPANQDPADDPAVG